jgi:hypothetical protein
MATSPQQVAIDVSHTSAVRDGGPATPVSRRNFVCFLETEESMEMTMFRMSACFGAVGCSVGLICQLPTCFLLDRCRVGQKECWLPGSSLVGWPCFLTSFCCCVCATPRRGEEACLPPICRCGCPEATALDVPGRMSHDSKEPLVLDRRPLYGLIIDRCDDFD